MLAMITPLVIIGLITFVLSAQLKQLSAKHSRLLSLATKVCVFATVAVTVLALNGHGLSVFAETAADATVATTSDLSKGLGYIAAALVTGMSCLGAGMAVASTAPAAIGAISENSENFGKAMIFVALAEGVAIYGLLISIMLITSF